MVRLQANFIMFAESTKVSRRMAGTPQLCELLIGGFQLFLYNHCTLEGSMTISKASRVSRPIVYIEQKLNVR